MNLLISQICDIVPAAANENTIIAIGLVACAGIFAALLWKRGSNTH
jgi:hypothetical protein